MSCKNTSRYCSALIATVYVLTIVWEGLNYEINDVVGGRILSNLITSCNRVKTISNF